MIKRPSTKTRNKKQHALWQETRFIRLTRYRRQKLRSLSEAQNHRCAYCCKKTHMNIDNTEDPYDRATLDHLLPLSLPRQTNKDENLVMACSHCNGLRGVENPMKFYNKIRCKPLSPRLKKKERKFSKDPIKLTKQLKKQGRLLAWCLIIVNFWPERVQPTIDYTPKHNIRKPYDQHINEIRKRIYENRNENFSTAS